MEKLLATRLPSSRELLVLLAAVVIYLAQYIVPDSISVSILGALLASLVIGLVDVFIHKIR